MQMTLQSSNNNNCTDREGEREGEGEDGEEKEARSFMSLGALWELAGNKRAKERCAGVAASLASLRLRAARLTGHICRALCIVNCE